MWCSLVLLSLLSTIQAIEVQGISSEVGVINQKSLSGSLYGGTILHISGFFLDTQAESLTVKVGSNLCEIIEFRWSSNYFQCSVPPADPLVPTTVAITFESTDGKVEIGSSVVPSFQYSLDFTPMVYNVVPTEAAPGDIIAFAGRWMTSDWSKVTSAGLKGKMLEVLRDDMTSLSKWSVYNVSALIGDNLHGDLNPEVLLTTGAAGFFPLGKNFDLTGQGYNFRVIGKIDSISSNAGSLLGGLELEISGAGFPSDTSKISIQTAGVPCTVNYADYNKLRCLTQAGASPAGSTFEGGAGVIRKMWNDTKDSFENLASVPPTYIFNEATTEIRRDEYVNTKSKIQTLFKAPKTAAYTFFLSSDDWCKVYLSTDKTEANKKNIIDFSGWTGYKQKLFYTNTISAPVNLVQGELYYLEVLHANTGGTGHFDMGVKFTSDGSKANKSPFIQKLTVSPPEAKNEVQVLEIKAPSGSPAGNLAVKYGGKASAKFAVDPTTGSWTCAQVLQALNDLLTGESFLCKSGTGQNSVYFEIEFTKPWSSTRKVITGDFTGLSPAGTLTTTTKIPGTSPILGNFTVTHKGLTSQNIAFGASSGTVEYAVNSQLASVENSLQVFGTVNSLKAEYWFYLPRSMISSQSDYFTIDVSALTGGGIQGSDKPNDVEFKSEVQYEDLTSEYYSVIPSEFLRTLQDKPQVLVEVEGRRVLCRGDCSFVYLAEADLPAVTGFTQTGSNLAVTGTGFDKVSDKAADFYVNVAGSPCLVSTVSASSLECSLSPTVAGSHVPVIGGVNVGKFPMDASITSKVIQSLSVSSISPGVFSKAGGAVITVTGEGFSVDTSGISAKFGSSNCEIVSTSFTEFKCKVSAYSDSLNSLEVTVGASTSTSDLATYTDAPTVTGITPDHGSTITSTKVTITGTNFDTDKTKIKVSLGSVDCLVTSASATEIKCNVLGGPPGVYQISIGFENNGLAVFDNSVSQSFALKFEISSISPAQGSIYGGTKITVSGFGFSTVAKMMYAFVENEDYICEIDELINDSTFTCITSEVGSTADSSKEFTLYGRLTDRATCTGSCSFTRSTSYSPLVTSISPASLSAGDSFTLTGSNFGSSLDSAKFTVNGVQATLTSLASGSIQGTWPAVKGSTCELVLNIEGRGNAKIQASASNVAKVSEVLPREFAQGGENIEIFGSGFNDGDTVTVGTLNCADVQVLDDRIKCRVPANSDSTGKVVKVGTATCSDASLCTVVMSTGKSLNSVSVAVSGTATISGSFPIVGISDIKVLLGTYSCLVTTASDTSISCVPDAPPGTYVVSVYISNYGYSTYPVSGLSATIVLSANSFTSLSSSFQGGAELSLTGAGLHEDIDVYVCNRLCETIEALGNSLKCSLPPLVSYYSYEHYLIQTEGKLIDRFTTVASGFDAPSKAYDSDTSVYASKTAAQVYIGLDIGTGRKLRITQVRFIGGGSNSVNYKLLIGLVLQASDNAITWEDINTFKGVTNYWNVWEVKENQEVGDSLPVYEYRYFRLYHASAASGFAINEVEWYGIVFEDNSLTTTTCSVSLEYGSTKVSASGTITYDSTLTPLITALDPVRGTTLGGVDLTITGQDFGSVAADVQVTIDGVVCAIKTVSSTSIVCTTGARPTFVPATLEVLIAGKGLAATQGFTFLYADLWSSSTTWGGEVPPREGESVWIPKGQNIVLDMATGHLGLVLIEGNLIVDDVYGITIDANYIFISGGMMQIGTEDKVFENEITITMHGNRKSKALPMYGNKFIAIRGGLLDIHGVAKTPSWTTLSSTVQAGSSTITLSQAVNWSQGDSIVIASTSYEFDEAEVRTILSIDATQKILTLDAPLAYKHYSNTDTLESDSIEMRAEVGCLSRNIKIRGSEEGRSEEHGVHIMFHKGGDEACVGRLENFELFYAGQAYTLGRYPIHFHMIGKVSKSYVKNNAIHDTFNRAVTIHGVHYFRVMKNVAYNIKGHTFFIEDGIESQNRIEGNLGVKTVQSWSLLNTDQAPATFWITNPNNFVRNNHAGGGTNYGFWISLDPHPSGPSATTTVCPQFTELGAFEDNVAHSYGKYGLRIWQRFMPLKDPCSAAGASNPYITTKLERFTAWKCKRDGAIGEELGDVWFVDFKVADNILAGLEVTYSHYSTWYSTTRISGAVVVGNSLNSEDLNARTKGIIAPQTDGFLIENVRFYNFNSDQYIFGDSSHSSRCPVLDSGGRLVKMNNIKIYNSVKRFNWGFPHMGFFEMLNDTNGFVSAGTHIVAPLDHIETPSCTYSEDHLGYVCNNEKVRRVVIHAPVPDYLVQANVRVLRTTGSGLLTTTETIDGVTSTVPKYSTIHMTKGQNNHRIGKCQTIPLVTGYEYDVHFSGDTPLDPTFFKLEQDIFESNDWVILRFNLTDEFENFKVTRGSAVAADLTDPTKTNICQKFDRPLTSSDPSCSYTFDLVEKWFKIIISGTPYNSAQTGDISVTKIVPTPPVPPGVPTGDGSQKVLKWSDAATWVNSSVPVDGSLVIVEPEWVLILDQDTPRLQYLEVNGILAFDSSKSVSINSKWIFVRAGQIISGNSTHPLSADYTHTINLIGNANDPKFYFDQAVEQSTKVLVVSGSVDLYGSEVTSYSYLAQNSYPGNNFIFVESATGWKAGDEIAIASSSFLFNESEVFKISQILSNQDFSTDPDWIKVEAKRSLGKISSNTPQQTVPSSPTGVVKLILNSTIELYHSGASIIVDNVEIDLRTEVALLTRNIKIIGEDNGWPGEVFVTDYYDEGGDQPVLRGGGLNLKNVQFENLGQIDFKRAGIKYFNAMTGSSSIRNTVFRDASSFGFHLVSAKNFVFDSNVIYNVMMKGLIAEYLESSSITNNLIIRVDNNQSIPVLKKFLSVGLHVCFQQFCDYTMTGNRVTGVKDIGAVYIPNDCSSTVTVYDNLYRSCKFGLITSGTLDCAQVGGGTVAFTVEGVQNIATCPELYYKDFKIAQSLLGIGPQIRYVNDSIEAYMKVSDSIFVGKTIHNACLNCSALECNNTAGVLLTLGTPKTEMGPIDLKLMLPLGEIDKDAHLYGNVEVESCKFYNFVKNSHCDFYDHAIQTIQYGPDHIFPMTISNSEFISSDTDCRVNFTGPIETWTNEDDCGHYQCTGPYNTFIKDLDGKFSGKSAATFFLPNNPGIAEVDKCTFVEASSGYLCNKGTTSETYGTLLFQSLDDDKMIRTFSPINITSCCSTFETYNGPAFFNQLQNFMDHSWSGFYTAHLKSSIYPAVVKTGLYLNISATGTLPNNMQFELLHTDSDSQAVIVAIWYQDPRSVVVYMNDKLVPAEKYTTKGISDCTFADAHGCNRWFFEQNTIQFVVRKGDPLVLKKIAVVQMNLEMDMTLDEFYSDNGPTLFVDRLAAMLDIPSYRIRIVNVRQGSVITDVEIIEKEEYMASTTTTSESQAELKALKAKLDSAASSGSLASTLGVSIIAYTAEVNTVSEIKSDTEDSSNNDGDEEDSDVNPGGDSGDENDPTGQNTGKGKSSNGEFSNVMNDWVIAILAGVLLLLITGSALLGAKKVSLMPSKITHEISEVKMPTVVQKDGFLANAKVSPEVSFNHH